MFTKKSNKKSENNDNNDKENSNSFIKSWLTGKIGSLLIFFAVGHALYKFGIINKITKFFKKGKGKGRADDIQEEITPLND
jgi:hypothetical protein